MKTIKLYPLITLILFSLNAYSQVDHWESLFNADTNFKYWSSENGDTETTWRSPSYDDSSWDEAPKSITVYNSLGMIIQSVPFDSSRENQEFTLYFDNRYQTGMYIFEIQFDSLESHIGRFIKVR